MRKSRFCGISTMFFQCCFMSETQVLMTVSDFFGVFFLETALFNGAGEGACFSVGRRVSIKYRTGWRPHAHPPITTMGNPDISVNRKKFCSLDQPTSLDRSSHLYLCYFVCPFVRPSTRLPAHLLTFHDGG